MLISALARAKINLALHVTGVRADGYHLLSSLVAFAGVGDVIEAQTADDLSLTITGDFAAALTGNAQDNLMLKVARLLQRHTLTTQGVALHLCKQLPVASGMGGGSADAAATAKLLKALWNMKITEAELAQLLLPLGADIPVCLLEKPAYMGGIGEEISALPPIPLMGVVLVNPLVQVSTASIFRQYDALGRWESPIPLPLPASATATVQGWVDFLKTCHNSLQPIAIAEAPVIAEVLAALEAQPECLLARMSGSGATCFGLCASAKDADMVQKRLRHIASHWWVQSGTIGDAEKPA